MEVVYIIGLIIVIVIMAANRNKRSDTSDPQMDALIDAMRKFAAEQKNLRKDVQSLKEQLDNIEKNTQPGARVAEPRPMPHYKEEPEVNKPVVPVMPAIVVQEVQPTPQEEPAPQPQPIPIAEPHKEEQPEEPVPAPQAEPEPIAASEVSPQPETPRETIAAKPNPAPPTHKGYPFPEPESPWEKWIRNNPDLEKFIGENLINKIGIAILVLGIAFFVKYAIDQNWINEVGRTCIGLLCGSILVGLAHYLRKGYRSFSSVLAGGGIATFYFTIAYAFHQYHLFSQVAAFVIMVIITAFAVALSILYDKLELAVIATLGGFITPFLISTGDGNYQVLFTYLIILDIGILSLAWFKRWPALNVISLFFTQVIFVGWLTQVTNGNKPYEHPIALLFATAFFFIFLGMNMVYQLRRKEHFKPFDFVILLSISCAYYGEGMQMLTNWHNGDYRGLFTLSMGIIYLALAYFIYKKGRADRNLLFLLIGLTLSFLTLTIPIQLHGHAITMFWCAEFVLLYWLSQYSGIRMFKVSSLIVCALAVCSLMMDWGKSGHENTYIALIFHNATGIVTNIVAIAAFATWYLLVRRSRDEEFLSGLPNSYMTSFSLTAAIILLYLTCIFGVNLTFRTLLSYDIPNVYHRLITQAFALTILILLQKGRLKARTEAQLTPIAICFLLYITSSGLAVDLRNGVLSAHYPAVHLYMHWLSSVLMLILTSLTIQGLRRHSEPMLVEKKVLMVLFPIVIITILSIEGTNLYVYAAFNKNNTSYLVWQFGKAGFTVIWAASSFALMWLGMKHREKTLRIISLTLFLIVLLKLFIFDIAGISEGGKILAFILLGVLLLIVSFMYQKLKKIIFDDHKEE